MRIRLSLTQWILVAVVLGVVLGSASPELAVKTGILSKIFIRLLQMLVVPLVFSTLVAGIATRSDGGSLKRVTVLAVVFFAVGTTLAASIGLLAANWFRPGTGAQLSGGASGLAASPTNGPAASFVERLIPVSVGQAMVGNDLLGLVFFTVLFALALRGVGADGDLLVRGSAALAGVMSRLTARLMWFAPFGVLGASAEAVGRFGLEGLRPFAKLLVAAYAAMFLFAVVFFVLTSLLARFRLTGFLRAIGDVLLLAFSTASGAAALPAAFDRLERWGAARRIISFVLPLGYSFNLTGTAVYLPLVTVFWAQIHGITLSWQDQGMLLGYTLVIIRGIPSVPRALFLIWGALLAQLHLPLEGTAILLAVDPVIDMARTAVNVGGNCMAVAAIDRWERIAEPPGGPQASRPA